MGPETDTDTDLDLGVPLAWSDDPPPRPAAPDPALIAADGGGPDDGPAVATDAAAGPRTAARSARRCRVLLADLLDLAADVEALAAELQARDLTAAEAADWLAEELPGVELWLSESATSARGRRDGTDGDGRLLTARVGASGDSPLFIGATWRAVAADVVASYRADGPNGGGR